MRLLYLSIIAFFITFVTNAQVTVKMNNIKTDNVPISNNTISFNSNLSINLSLDVQLLTSDNSSNNTFGNLFFYYKPSANEAPVQVGFQTITFVQNFPLLNYISSVSYTNILLNKANFLASGGVFYCEYKNNNNQIFKSSTIPITITNTIPTPTPTPTPTPAPAVTLSTNIKYSDNLPILDNKIFIPKNSTRSVSVSLTLTSKEINSNGKILLTTFKKREKDNTIADEISRTELNSFTINDNNIILNIVIDANLVPTDQTKFYYLNFYVNNNLYNLGTVIASDPIINNIITDSQFITSPSYANPFLGTVAKINLGGIRNTIDITTYQWQYKTNSSDWQNIPDATSLSYAPTYLFNETTSFRRLALTNYGDHNLSQFITISNTTQPINIICCDQKLTSVSSQPAPFTGNTLDNSFTYQWQISEKLLPWSNITNGTSSSCAFRFLVDGGRGLEGARFRRLITQNSNVLSISNIINVTGRIGGQPTPTGIGYIPNIGPRGKIALKIAKNKENLQNNTLVDLQLNLSTNAKSDKDFQKKSLEIDNINIYPNPVDNFFYVESNRQVSSENVIVMDLLGRRLDVKKTQSSDNVVKLDCSILPAGQFIVIINQPNRTYKKIIKN